MLDLLASNPLLLLFVVAAIGYPLGQLNLGGVRLGVAAVLFVGLAIGSLDERLKLPEVLYQFGLVMFVYTVGLSSGHQFFRSWKSKGLRDNLFIGGMIVVAYLFAILAHSFFSIKPTLTVGLFTGTITNTPALAAAIEYLKSVLPEQELAAVVNDPVVGYSIAYPMGVVAMMLAIVFVQRLWRIDYVKELASRHDLAGNHHDITSRTVEITNPEVTNLSVQALIAKYHWPMVFGRYRRDGHVAVTTGATQFMLGDHVSIVGASEVLEKALAVLGKETDDISNDRRDLDYRRMFVSNPKIVGIRLEQLNLPQVLGATITRVRRGDVEMLPTADTRLELGDRVRVIARRADIPQVSRFFGDSYRALSEVDILTFTLGLVLGLVVGSLVLPLPGGVSIKLGFAGGPLVVSLILGALDRTGPLVWNMPYSTNLTLRQIGIVMFLAGVGTRAGYDFVKFLFSSNGLLLFGVGAAITFSLAMLILTIGYKVLKIPMGILTGMLAGFQTQPALLSFALQQSNNELPNQGYAAVYPLALIIKIILAQLLLIQLL
ncbi:MAG TPA: transporter [Herpetosiphon sp.]|uniref:YidE/YbjL duplication n=1 Tax=Herpetosiphon aurantiacus (strain ATCC 23779 / DSM 785 / 114-95) TaxID=316274 RepID=A9B7W3_HERA2|nr:TrkA C-terminal domain-containing protein [Herpetosiphon sp.]ABX04491.1 YidE/YbjL duplication [Herpetosiphon aurantiacus DSM 785]HBW52256.1 transporter [Herpetosiphon sp.]